jgi:hypothetical protein
MLRLVMEAIATHPVDVPTRATKIRVQWTSGAVSELSISHPRKGESRAHAPDTIERIRQLASGGLHDDEIARQLNTEGRCSGAGLAWKEDTVRGARRHKGIELVVADRPRMRPLPYQHPDDGRYSIPGAMAHFGVTENVVRAWIRQGLVRASRADYGTHRGAYWLEIDDVSAVRLLDRRRLRQTSKP